MGDQQATILLIDDESDLLRLWKLRLESNGYTVVTAESGEEGLAAFTAWKPDVVLTDLRMPGIDGMALFEAIRQQNKSVPVIIITAHGSIPEAVEATRQGVFSFLTKPIDGTALVKEIQKALALSTGKSENRDARKSMASGHRLPESGHGGVALQGETGGGDGCHCSYSRGKRYREKSCWPLPSTRPASTEMDLLFRSIVPQFPRASWSRSYLGMSRAPLPERRKATRACFQSAHNGTLFLDEIGDMPLHIQVKLLRVLQDRKIRPAGSAHPIPVNVRIISATHRNLEEAIKENTFREDLFYRLNVVSLELPPLQQRREDIPLLAEHFVALLQEKDDGQEKTVHPPMR